MFRYHIRTSISEQFPGRLNPAKEAHLPDKPTTNIFIRSAYKTQYYSVSEALQMHRLEKQIYLIRLFFRSTLIIKL